MRIILILSAIVDSKCDGNTFKENFLKLSLENTDTKLNHDEHEGKPCRNREGWEVMT